MMPIDPKAIDLGAPAWGSDVVADTLMSLGYRYIALVPGSSFRGFQDSLVNRLGAHGPTMLVCLHEEHAVAIADGYSRVANEPMAVALHANVGLMHASMTIYNAWCDRRPMLIIGATGPVDASKRRPWIDWIHTSRDQGALIRHFVKWDDQPGSAAAAVESVLRADMITRTSPSAPVYVCLDVEMQESPLEESISIPPIARYSPPDAPVASPLTLDRLGDALDRARCPVFLFGRGSRSRSAWENRVGLAELYGARVLTTLHNASSFPTEHPLHDLAPVGERPVGSEKSLLEEADLIVSFDWHDLGGFLGARLGSSTGGATIVHCSLDETLSNGWSMDHQRVAPADIRVQSDPDQLVAQLLQRGTANPVARKPAAEAAHWTEDAPEGPEPGAKFNSEQLAFALIKFARDRDVTFARLPFGWPRCASRFRSPLDFLGKDGGGAVGTGPGHTIGAALALKDSGRLAVGVMGDGDFLMGSNALWTASNQDIAMMIVVANNRSYFNDEVHQERVALQRGRPVENKGIGQRLTDPDIDIIAIARAQGFDGRTSVRDVAGLQEELERGAQVVAGGGRYIIDALIEPGYSDR